MRRPRKTDIEGADVTSMKEEECGAMGCSSHQPTRRSWKSWELGSGSVVAPRAPKTSFGAFRA